MAAMKDSSKSSYAGNTRQKVLLPTLKEQQRYIVYGIVNVHDVKIENFRILHEQIIHECNKMLGLFDGARAGLMSAKYNDRKLRGIIRVNNNYVDKLKVCLGLIKNIRYEKNENEPLNILVECEYVSGLLNKAEEHMNK